MTINNNTTQEELRRITYETLGICPITQEPITSKMTLSCNHSFEQSAILEWILNNQNNEGDSTCPMCRSIIVFNRPQRQNETIRSMALSSLEPLRPMRNRRVLQEEQREQTYRLSAAEKETIICYMVEHGLFTSGQCLYLLMNSLLMLDENHHYVYHVFNSCYPNNTAHFKRSFDPTHKNDIVKHLKKCIRTFAINPIQTPNPTIKDYIEQFEKVVYKYIRDVINVFGHDGFFDIE